VADTGSGYGWAEWYQYVGSDPVNWVDPFGLCGEESSSLWQRVLNTVTDTFDKGVAAISDGVNKAVDSIKKAVGLQKETYTKDSDRYYQVGLEVFKDSAFDYPPPKCNQYAAEVLYQYTGSTELKGEGSYEYNMVVVDQYAHITSSDDWHKVDDGREAQQKANEGYYTVGITPDPNHIAVVVPGEGVELRDQYFPAIGQKGASEYYYGETDEGTANWGWRQNDQQKIEYYYKE